MRKKMKVLLFRAILIGLAVFLTGMIFPSYSYAATASLQITAGADDATEDARQAVTTTDELQVRSYPGATPWQRRSTGLRFQNIPVPRGATVISSYISIFPSLATANDVNARIYVENTADASDFVVNRHIINPAYRPRTTAFTSWVQDDVAVNTYVNGPSLNAPLQELFNRADWAAGNDLAILMIANEDIDKIVRFWNQEKYLNLPVKLYIEYSTGPVPDTTPPVRSNGQPTGTLPAGTTSVTISLTTNEPATARYATTPGVSYDAMSNNFTTTGGTSHSTLVTGLADGNTYTYYVRTSDAAGNNNTDDYLISFSIALPDTTPPVRSNGQPTGTLPAGTTSATLSLTTNEPATARYSTTPGISYDSMSNNFTTTGGTSHSTLVTGLADGNTYTYYVKTSDAAGNRNTDDYTISFSVALPDTTPPVISNVQATGITSFSATITWTTDDLSDSTVNYGTTTALGSTASNANMVTSHSMPLNGLAPDTTYYYQVSSRNARNLVSTSSMYNFTTAVQIGPTTIDLQVMVGADDATENARGIVTLADLLMVSSYPGATPWQRISTGLRFQNVAIPRGAAVIASYLSIYPSDPAQNDANMSIYLENTADATSFTTNPHIIDPAYRPRTTAFTSWVQDDVAVNTYVNSPSLNAPLQELFSRADWAAGNDLAILMIANEDNEKSVRFLNKEQYLNLPVKLHIEYGNGAPDTTPPVRSNGQPTVTLSAGTTSVTLSLTTNEPATARYSTTPGVSYDAMSSNFSTTGGTSHSTLVTGLADGNTYTYYVRTIDAAGNRNTDDYPISFSIALPDTTPPVISNVQATGITSFSATITWTTDDLSDSTVNYGTTTALGSTASNTNMVTAHSITMANLAPSTTYYYQVSSRNDRNLVSSSSIYNFTTVVQPPAPPERVHLSFGEEGTETTVVVTWSTAAEAGTVVQYGTSPSYGLEKTGTSFYSSLFGYYIHSVELTGLSYSTTYYYQAGAPGGWSAQYSFVSPPQKGNTAPFTFVSWADYQKSYDPALKDLVKSYQPRFVLDAGDVVQIGTNPAEWNRRLDLFEDLVASSPWMIAEGNHDDYVPYNTDLMTFPNNEEWYSFNYGNTHFISLRVISASRQLDPGSPQYIWLQNDLQQASNDPNIKWKVVFFHVPAYASGSLDQYGGNIAVRGYLEPLFNQYEVDLALTGHYHDYERTYMVTNDGTIVDYGPNYDGRLVGTVHVVNSGAGGDGGPLAAQGVHPWTARFLSGIGAFFATVRIEDNVLYFKAIDLNNTVIDEFTITK